jgi:two-component system nitrate/nitrite response regulator NarL
MTKIIIADDHQIVIDGIKSLLQSEVEIQIIGEAQNGKVLLESEHLTEADLVLMDLGMPELNGLEASKALRIAHPNIKILVLTTYADQRSIKDMVKIGVDGYVLKDSGKANFLEAISTIMAGEKHYDKRVTDVLMNSFNPKKSQSTTPTPLTEREKDVIRLIAEGLSTNEIANKLFLSAFTIETHRKNIFTKLGFNKVASLVRYAIEEGLVD